MSNDRLYFFDNLKFILISLVVIGHFLQFYLNNDYITGSYLFIYSFHMPLFVFVTGFFAKSIIKADSNKRLNKIISFFLIYLLYKAIIFLIINYMYHENYNFLVFTEAEAPWYLCGCTMWIIITNVFKNVKPLYLFIFSFICFLFIGYDVNIGDQFSLSRVIVFYPFYLLGYYMTIDNAKKLIKFLHSKKFLHILAVTLLIVIYFLFINYANELYFLRPIFTARNPFSYVEFPTDLLITGAAFRLFWFIYVILIALAFFIIVPDQKTSYSEFGSRTLQVYVLHLPIVLILMHEPVLSFLVNLFGNHVYFALVIMGFITCAILSLKCFEKPFIKLMKYDFSKLYIDK